MTMESTRYTSTTAGEEPLTVIHSASLTPPESITVVDVGRDVHLFERKTS